jgi:hypothetical protein
MTTPKKKSKTIDFVPITEAEAYAELASSLRDKWRAVRAQLAERDAELAERDAMLAERDRELEELRRRVARRGPIGGARIVAIRKAG